ncbi:SGNH/GDSL hydrolase family protein [Arundinibacter roseus]|uniref:SGNH/GDSL hydrolase family protein n=1 Tax=Arundinibacter roseus TaxID=2070510 RepID=A0A4R4JX73_9BACT|nr:SGNH/GDSL hydrolase family protein [Arundinibacter roseus]TDB58551.1 SGNH/GDSL hydrolase family protein [Arundinibacter roseus]
MLIQQFAYQYDYTTSTLYTSGENTTPFDVTCTFRAASSNSQAYLGSTQGSHIGYEEVTVYHGQDQTSGGKTWHRFTTYRDNPDTYPQGSADQLPFPPPTSKDAFRGLELEAIDYIYENNNFRALRKKNNFYTFSEINIVLGIKMMFSFKSPGGSYQSLVGVSNYGFCRTWVKLDRQTEELYDSSEPQVSETQFTYSPINLQILSRQQTLSNEDKLTTRYVYPQNLVISAFPSPSSELLAIKKLQEKNVVNAILEETQTLKKKNSSTEILISGTYTSFKSDQIGLKESVWQIETVNPLTTWSNITVQSNGTVGKDSRYRELIKFERYDEYGNLAQQRLTNDFPTAYVWSHDGALLAGEIKNALYDQVKSALGSDYNLLSTGTLPDNSVLNIWNNKIRNNSLFSTAFVTTFTHKPLVGISSQSDNAGLNTYYNYDSFNRLSAIKDHNQNLVKTFHYNYGLTGSIDDPTLISPNFRRIVIVGNSITKLQAQSGTDGWQSPALSASGGWGRASSTLNNDFAHILESRFKQLNPAAQVLPLWEAPFERNYVSNTAGWISYNYAGLKNRITLGFGLANPDLVIIRLGENILNTTVESDNFKGALNTLIDNVLAVSTPGAKVLLTNSIWPDQPLANAKIQEVANERNFLFVDLSDMYYNPVFLAGNDPAVLTVFPNNIDDIHPGDVGMMEIADRIWGKLLGENKNASANQSACTEPSVTITSPIEGTVPGTTIPGNSGLIMPITMSVCVPSGQSVVRVDVIAKTPDGSVQRRVGIAKAVAGSPGTYRIDAVMVGNGVEGGWLPTIGGNNYPGNPNAQTGPLAPNATFVYWAELVTSAGGTPIESPEVSVLMTPPTSIASKARIQVRGDHDFVLDRYSGGKFEGSNDLNSWQLLYTIPVTPRPTLSQWVDCPFAVNTQAYRYLRFKSSENGYGELAEIEFYDGSTKLTGSWTGSPGRTYPDYPTAYPLSNAYDGNSSTFWHGNSAGIQNWIMLDTQGGSTPQTATVTITSPIEGTVPGTTVSGNSGLIMPITMSVSLPSGQSVVRVDVIAKTPDGSVQRRVGIAKAVAGSPGTYRIDAVMVGNGVEGGWLPTIGGDNYPGNPNAQTGPLAPNATFVYWAELVTSAGGTPIESPEVSVLMTPLTSIASKARIQVRGDHDFVLDRYSGGKFEGSNDLNSWQLLYTIPVTPRPTLSQWVDCPFTGNPQSYRYLRYTAGSTSAGELAEIEFYDGSTKLTGSWTGSPGRTYPDYPTAYPLSNAYDGNSSTFWHGNSAGIQNWIMLDTQGGSTPQAASVTITSPIEGTVPGTTIPGNSGLIMPITMSVSLPSGQSVVRVDVIAKTPDGSVQRRVGIAKAVAGSPGTYRIDAVMVGNGVEGGWLPTIGGDNYPGNPNAQTGPLAPNATFVYWAELVTSAGGTPIESPEVSILMTPPASVATKARILTRQDFNYTNRFNGAVFEGATSLSGPWQTLVAINSSNLPSWTTYKEYEFTGNTQTYRYLRFKSSGSGYGELAEIEFYNGSTKLTGSWRAFDDRASYPLTNAYDGNSSTFWHGVSLGSQNWIMLDTQGQSNATSAITTPTNGSSVVGSPAQGYSGLYIMPITVVTQVPAGQTITRVDIVARTTSGSVVQRRIGTASPVPGSPGTYRVNASMVANGQSGGWLPPMAGEYPINPGAQFGPLAPNANFWYWAEVTTSPDNQIIKSPAVTATMTLSQ